MEGELIRAEKLVKGFLTAEGRLDILKGVDLTVSSSISISIIGKSGCGKSTLLSVLASLEKKDGGKIYYGGRDLDLMKAGDLCMLRRNYIGFIFQNPLLMEDFSAVENVMMPLLLKKKAKKEAYKEALEYLDIVKLAERASHRPKELSGGERQRVAIARSLASGAAVVFADEPTGSLDEQSAREVEKLLFDAVRIADRALVMVTHDEEMSRRADIRYALRGGLLERL